MLCVKFHVNRILSWLFLLKTKISRKSKNISMRIKIEEEIWLQNIIVRKWKSTDFAKNYAFTQKDNVNFKHRLKNFEEGLAGKGVQLSTTF